MIAVLFAKITQLTNRLLRINEYTDTSLFGDGVRGNVFIGKDDDITPEIMEKYEHIFANSSGNITMPMASSYNFKDLYIAEGSTLQFPYSIATIRVNETLHLYGTISMANKIEKSIKSKNCPGVKSIIESLGHQKMFTENGFYLTGGTGNTAIFQETPSGGCAAIYYCNLWNDDGYNLVDNFNNSVLYNGGTDGLSGGYIGIAANNIILGPSGYINVNGGTGDSASSARKGLFINARLKSIDFNE